MTLLVETAGYEKCLPFLNAHNGLFFLDGMIIIECREPVTGRPTGEIIFDALTDSVIHFKGDRFGRPFLSPDSRKLVTVSHDSTGTTLLVQRLTGTHTIEAFACLSLLLFPVQFDMS